MAEEIVCRCGRPASAHKPVDMDAIIRDGAQRLADDIDGRIAREFRTAYLFNRWDGLLKRLAK